jgi:predicted protein tyrosine phosphatase
MQEVDLSTLASISTIIKVITHHQKTPRAADNLESAKNVFHLQGMFQQKLRRHFGIELRYRL